MKKDISTDVAEPAIDRTVIAVLENHQQGHFITDISVAMKQVANAILLAGKGGKVTITLNMKPASAGSAATVIFTPEVKTTLPKLPVAGSIFYADDDFNLLREDPRQKKLALRHVEANPPGELREAGK